MKDAPAKAIVTLTLSPEQAEQLKPWLNFKVSDRMGCVFALAVSSYDPATGGSTAKLECACLPWLEAKTVINTIRKAFGIAPHKISKKK